jgi:hypothetical protein
MKYYYILAIFLVLVILFNLYLQQEGFIAVKSDVANGDGLSKEYLLHNIRLFNENIRKINVVKQNTDGNTIAKPATLKINGKDFGIIEDIVKSQLKNVDYIDITMKNRNMKY